MSLIRLKLSRALSIMSVSLLLSYTSSYAQSSSMNYVETKTYLDAAGSSFLRHIDYYDDLGFVSETVDVGQNTTGTPLVSKTEYNTIMKPYCQWGPVPSTGLEFLDDVFDEAETTYGENQPYSMYEYDDFKELSRSSKPGEAWEDRWVTVTRCVVPAGVVRKYSVSSDGALSDDGTYPYGVLTSITTTDEDGRSVTVYSNIHENTVLERRGADNDTYYVYDTYGRLCYVLPPMCQQCSTAMMPKYWYKYTYDDRGRCTEKQLPGCAAVKYWYDSADRIQSEQDGCLRERSQYRNYSYDATGRLILQTVSTTRGEATQNNAVAVEVKNYYDGYAFRLELGQLFPEWADSINAILPTVEARNKLTATMRGTSNGSRYCEIYRYDMNGRVMYTLSAYGDKWMKTAHTTYNFAGDVTGMEERVYTSNSNISLLAGRRIYNSYYPSTRLLKRTMVSSIDRSGVGIGQNISKPTYDVLGNITGNDRPGTAADMTYSYDILHGWLKGISSPSGFSEQLQRETADNAQYAGNIGSMQWRNAVNGELHKYDYTYDGLGRLTDSQYSSSVNGTDGRFDESLTYNRNGSITSLLRSGMRNDGTFGVIDDLSVNYDGNRLLKVTDDAESLNYNGALDFNDGADMTAEYEYDSTGALTKDRNRGITGITYDLSHNPQTIVMNGGQIVNDYTSDGRKLCSTQSTGMTTTTDMYVDGLIIRNGAPLTWQFNGGYVSLGANSVPQSWNYYITDHLGSTRMVVDSQNIIKETINYYPFGSEMTMTPPAQLTSNPNWQPYRFTGKELVRQNGLNMYDFGARWYDVAGVPVWTSMDPLCEKNYPVTPYSYCNGDPVNRFDPDGLFTVFINGMNLFSGGSPDYWGNFDKNLMQKIQEISGHVLYRDGSINGFWGLNLMNGITYSMAMSGHRMKSNMFAEDRHSYGYAQGKYDAAFIVSQMQRNKKGFITEKLRLVTHSMGGAYGKGYAQAIVDYAYNNKDKCEGLVIDEYDLAPYQTNMQQAVWGVNTYQWSHVHDKIAGNSLIRGAVRMTDNYMGTDWYKSHTIDSYEQSNIINQIMSLPQGVYIFSNGEFIKQQ
ncbi:MAG: RHS repeat-associated core domain-containing protein [Prevotella sp.]|nr:RHS repeat-associated core domain-containing protein [Prevotella sp.]